MADPVSSLLLKALGAVFERWVAGLFDSAGHAARDRRRLRELARPELLIGKVGSELERLRLAELPDLPAHEWLAATEAVRDSFTAAGPMRTDRSLRILLDAAQLEEYVRSQSEQVRREAGLSEAATIAYDRLLTRCCQAIVERVRSLSGLQQQIQQELREDVRDTLEVVRRLPVLDEQRRASAHRAFERRYTDYVVRRFDSFELFGVGRGRAPRKHSFDKSYVSLAVARRVNGAEPDADLSGAGVHAATAFTDTRRVLLRGGAGAGKTTFLRWLALRAARGGPAPAGAVWRDAVPFFVSLRNFSAERLPRPEQLVELAAEMLADEKPPAWVSSCFLDGRALLLVDGIDELVSESRAAAKEWLEHLVAAYPDSRYVVTTRPSAVPEDWLDSSDFAAFDLLPMSDKGVRDFLVCWHEAARSEHAADQDMVSWLHSCERNLAETLSARPELRRLAASPLLCGLLCALHQDRNMHLPRDRRSLYEAALDLLLVRWDEQRGVRLDRDLGFSKEEQLVLLQRFAYSFVRNRELVLSREEASQRIGHAMRGLRPHEAEPDQVLQRTLERTGLLREPHPDQVQFVHRTFRDYLAAKEVVDAGDLNLLVANAHLDEWHDVVVMAVANARPRERARVLQELLAGNDEARRDQRVRDRLHLVAAACLEQADVVEPNEVRAQVQQAVARLIPPANANDAEILARAGSFVLDLLPGPEGLTEAESGCVVRTAAMIGGEGAWEKIAQFTSVDETTVIDELLRAWRMSPDPEDYARTVLADVDFGERRVDVRGWHRIKHLGHLRRLAVIRCLGSLTPLDPFAAVPRLRRLELMQNEVVRDLRPLVGCRTLRELHLTHCSMLRDLSPLAESTVDDLSLHFTNADLSTLAGAPLRCLRIRHPGLNEGLEPLPAGLPLRELVLDNRPPNRSLSGIGRWPGLERLSLFGLPDEAELALLAELPVLRRIELHGIDDSEAEALAPIRSALPDVDLTLPDATPLS